MARLGAAPAGARQNGLLHSSDPFDLERFAEVAAIAAEIGALGGDAPEELAASWAAQGGYATPKVDVRALAFRDGRILLVRGTDDGLWTPPGGWAEVGETAAEAAEKELCEESGYAGRAIRLLVVYDRDVRARPRLPFHAYKLAFQCELTQAEPDAPQASEISEVGFFHEDGLPPLSERVGDSPKLIEDAFARLHDPSLPAAFD